MEYSTELSKRLKKSGIDVESLSPVKVRYILEERLDKSAHESVEMLTAKISLEHTEEFLNNRALYSAFMDEYIEHLDKKETK